MTYNSKESEMNEKIYFLLSVSKINRLNSIHKKGAQIRAFGGFSKILK
jgi:predicted amino acid dehydrogenase